MPVASTELTTYGYGRPTQATATQKPILPVRGQGGSIFKYDQNGQVLWEATVSGTTTNSTFVTDVDIDISGNIYATGQYVGTLYIYNANGTPGGSLSFDGVRDSFILKFDPNGYLQWATSVSGTLDDSGWGISVDLNGNVYVAGSYQSAPVTVYNAPFKATTAGTLDWTAASTGSDIFIVKYNSSGTAQWRTRLTSAANDTPYDIATDTSGNVYVAGIYTGALTVNSQPGTTVFGTLANSGGIDAFLVKYDTNGTAQAMTRIAGGSTEFAYDIAVDASANVYVTGYFTSNPVTVFSAPGTTAFRSIESLGLSEMFIVKYNSSLIAQWSTRIGGTGEEEGSSVAVDSSQNVYVTGYYTSSAITLFYPPGDRLARVFGTMANPTGAGVRSAFVVKYDRDGNPLWATRLGGLGLTAGTAIAVDSDMNVYVTGGYPIGGANVYNADTSIFTRLPGDYTDGLFIVKYNPVGFGIWATRIAGGNSASISSLQLDSSRNLVFGGSFSLSGPTSMFSPDVVLQQPYDVLSSAGGFVVKYNKFGSPQWTVRMSVSNPANFVETLSAAGLNGNVYIAGQVIGSVSIFNQDATLAETLTGTNTNQIFITQYSPTGYEIWGTLITGGSSPTLSSIDTDSDGNVYIAGYVVTTVNFFNKGGSLFRTLTTTAGRTIGFLVKYNSDGDAQWVSYVLSTTAGSYILYDLKVDLSNNMYIVVMGSPSSILTFYNSDNTSTFSVTTASGITPGILCKYNSSGTLLWGTFFTRASLTVVPYSIGVDTSNNVYVGGYYGGAILDFYNQPGTTVFTSLPTNPTGDGFLVKYDSDGNGVWATRMTATNLDAIYSVSVDPNNTIFVSGWHNSLLTPLNANTLSTAGVLAVRGAGGNQPYIAAYNPDGTVKWINGIATSDNVSTASATSTDGSGNVLMTVRMVMGTGVVYNMDGSEFANLSFRGQTDGYLIKYDGATGNPLETTFIGGFGSAVDIVDDVALDYTTGDYYVSGKQTGGSGLMTYSSSRFLRNIESDSGSGNAFLAKYDNPTNMSWVATIAGGRSDVGSMVIDASDNIYTITRLNTGDRVIHSTGGVFTTISLANTTRALIKYNKRGIVQWVSLFQNASTQSDPGISVDAWGNVYVSGGYVTTQTTIYNSDGTLYKSLTALTADDAFLVKYNPSGMVLWDTVILGAGFESATSTVVDFAGNVFVMGSYNVTPITVFNSDGTIFGTLTTANSVFIVKYNSSGMGIWQTKITGTSVSIRSSAVDSGGNLIVCGSFTGTLTTFNQPGIASAGGFASFGLNDTFIVRYRSDGIRSWLTRVGGTSNDTGGGVVIDRADNSCYVIGSYLSAPATAYSVGDVAAYNYANSGTQTDIFVAKYDINGVFVWGTRMYGTLASGIESGSAVAVDASGNVYFGGTYETGLNIAGRDGNDVIVIRNTSLFTSSVRVGFLASFTSSGTFRWVANLPGYAQGIISGNAVDSTGAIYTAGAVTGKTIYAYSA